MVSDAANNFLFLKENTESGTPSAGTHTFPFADYLALGEPIYSRANVGQMNNPLVRGGSDGVHEGGFSRSRWAQEQSLHL